jgi:hypothetical protein
LIPSLENPDPCKDAARLVNYRGWMCIKKEKRARLVFFSILGCNALVISVAPICFQVG